MGRIIQFPARPGAPCPRPEEPEAQPTLTVADDPRGSDAEEFAAGLREGTYAARHWIVSRDEFLSLFEARLAGGLEFLRALQHCAFVRKDPAAASAPIGAFASHMYGRQGGGAGGPYAHGHRAGIMLCEPFVRSLH